MPNRHLWNKKQNPHESRSKYFIYSLKVSSIISSSSSSKYCWSASSYYIQKSNIHWQALCNHFSTCCPILNISPYKIQVSSKTWHQIHFKFDYFIRLVPDSIFFFFFPPWSLIEFVTMFICPRRSIIGKCTYRMKGNNNLVLFTLFYRYINNLVLFTLFYRYSQVFTINQ